LEKEGLVTQHYLGRKRIACLDFENEKTLVALKIMKLLNSSVDLKHPKEKY
jgi:hypothetical protein